MLGKRPPIIAVLGHVDHGKTTLLDTIRHSSVQLHETGGITQHIGAYQITYQDSPITFIDTPGHAAFTTMRARGGQSADLGILVVAADDGVMPQTKESITLFQEAGTPFLVAINKIDLPDAQPQKIRAQLAEAGLLVEGYGGNIPVVEISAKANLNLDKLLENLLIMAELEELTADPDGHLEAVIIESTLDRHKGPVATLIVKNGTLRPGDKITTLPHAQERPVTGRVKSLITWPNKTVTAAPPSFPAQVLGFDSLPPVGAVVTLPGQEAQVAQTELTTRTTAAAQDVTKRLSIVLKADTIGTLEAIEKSLPPEVDVLLSDTGPINESDVLLLSGVPQTEIIGFRVAPTPSAKKLSSVEHVTISTYASIYDLVDDLKERMAQAAADAVQELITGSAKVLKIFDMGTTKIIGGKVESGSLLPGDRIRLLRGDRQLGEAVITSLRIGREAKDKIRKGEEFGAVFDTPLDFAPQDDMVAFKIINQA